MHSEAARITIRTVNPGRNLLVGTCQARSCSIGAQTKPLKPRRPLLASAPHEGEALPPVEPE